MKKLLITFLVFVFSMSSSYGETLNYEYGNYEGEVENGQANGYGIFTYTKGESKGAQYVGEFKYDRFSGQGVFTGSDGTVYAGQFLDDALNGDATATYPSGDVYVGQWLNDSFHGYGTYIWKETGSEYSGQYKNHKKNGVGTLVYSAGENSSDKYVGEWKDGHHHGKGTYTWSDGKEYRGEYVEGEKNGDGILVLPNGDSYEGSFRDGLAHGYGRYKFQDGRTYIGEWVNDAYHGYGKFWWPSGEFYAGEFRDNVSHGEGTHTYSDGTKFVGEFKNGKQWNGVRYLASGGVSGTVTDSKLCDGCDVTLQQSIRETDLPTSASDNDTWSGYPVSYASGSFDFNTLTGSAQGIKLSFEDGTSCEIKNLSGGSHENVNIDKRSGVIGELTAQGIFCSNGSSTFAVDDITLKEVPLNQIAFSGEVNFESDFSSDRVLDQIKFGFIAIGGLKFRHEEFSMSIEEFYVLNANDGFIERFDINNLDVHVEPYRFRLDNWVATNAPVGSAQSDYRSYKDNYLAIEGVSVLTPEFEMEVGRYQQPKPVVTKTRMLYEMDLTNIVLREGRSPSAEVRQLVGQLGQDQLVLDANLVVDSTSDDNNPDRKTKIGVNVAASPLFRISMETLLSTPKYADRELSKFFKLMFVDSNSSDFKNSARVMSVLTGFREATVRLENESLVEIALQYLESYTGNTQAELLQTVRMFLQSIPGDSSTSAQLTSALDRFLVESGTFIFSLSNEENISLFQMVDTIGKQGLLTKELNPSFRFVPTQ